MFRVGMSSCGELTEALFADYAKNGIGHMEISMPWEKCDALDLKWTKKMSEEYGVNLWSYHLPFAPFSKINPASLDKEIRKYTVEYFTELMSKASDIGLDKFVVHASGEPIAPEDRAVSMDYAMESLDRLAEIAARYGAIIAVEDLPRTCLGNCSDEMLKLVSANSKLKMCFDTNHLLGEDIPNFVKMTGKYLVTTHISDYDFANERHWLPGEGQIDWQALVRALKDVDYQGVWMYEISLPCPKTIYRDRDLNCADFARNAKELFEGKTPTVFSRPKPNLGMWE